MLNEKKSLTRHSCSRCLPKHPFITVTVLLMLTAVFLLEAKVSIAQTAKVGSQTLSAINAGDEWHFLKGLEPPASTWMRGDFDHSAWSRGPSGIGYGIGSNRTYLSDMKGNYLTIFARKEFSVTDLKKIGRINLRILCDGPFSAYLNGMRVIQTKNRARFLRPDQSLGMNIDLSGIIHEVLPGRNVLAVECSNDDINSDDFTFVPVLEILDGKEGK